MPIRKQLTVRLNKDLYERAMNKCYDEYGIGLSSLVKMFLRAFVTQEGIGFYVGDQDLRKIFARWVRDKTTSKMRGSKCHLFRPTLKDLFEF